MHTTSAFVGHQLIERGGEFVDTNHRVLFALADELGLTLTDLAQAVPVGLDSGNCYFVGGQLVEDRRILDAFARLVPAIIGAPDAGEDYRRLDREHSMLSWLVKHAEPLLIDVLTPAYVAEYGCEMDEMSIIPFIETFRSGTYPPVSGKLPPQLS